MRGITGAIRRRPATFGLVTLVMFALHIVVPPIVLSLARKPVDYFAFNAWLPNLPSFLASSEVTWQRKLEVLPKLALFWCASSNPYGVEWGFAVDVIDLARFVFTSALIGAYFTLLSYRRAQPFLISRRLASRLEGAPARTATRGGVIGGFVSVLGLSTGPCSVMGCGAPVIPVVGLVLAGLSSTTLKFLHNLSTIATAVVLAALITSVAYLAWSVGSEPPAAPTRA